ncbi:MAG: DEAD/DEAH box helicase [Bacillota bacterium]|nr:DEAD/DEAH box helicase [Bacillota bacterium]
MNKLTTIYPLAIEQTKKKILEDINLYLGARDQIASYEHYKSERKKYIEQIWINVWLNKATNDVPRKEKKQLLSERGFEVEGIDRKIINKLFRDELRNYKPFNVIHWMDETFLEQNEEWEDRYQRARLAFFQHEEEEKLNKKKIYFQNELENLALSFVENNVELLYLNVRHLVAKHLSADFKKRKKYQNTDTFALEDKLVEEGAFQPSAYTTLSYFFNELTGNIHKTVHWGRGYFEYETFYYEYERFIGSTLSELLPKIILNQLTSEFKDEFEKTFQEKISPAYVKRCIGELLFDVEAEFLEDIQEEYVRDLLTLAEVPFNLDIHKEMYTRDLVARETKKAEELAVLKQKRAEEARMMEDIFGQEYDPSVRRKIHYVLHIGETNTGKTHHALEKMKEAESGIYLAPLRLLALEVFDKLNDEGTPCSLKTGEEEKTVANARHISCTVEMFHEKEFYDVVVIDEAQMITDKDRGFSWYKAITKTNANEVHIIGSKNAKKMLLQLLGDADIDIHEYTRDTPLEVESKEFSIKNIKKGDALICFSRRRVLETAARLQNDGYSVSMIYGSMPPETRKKQIEQFINGNTKIIVATDAIGMGLNLPIHRIVFLENEKFDGTKRRQLTSQEVKQIAGRAGRKGIYDVGKVAFTADIKEMRRLLLQEDEPVHSFAIAPTNSVFERFQQYYHDLGTFFELWKQFQSPTGTKKASLLEERDLYEIIQGTEIEGRLSLTDLYGFLHLPFSSREPQLIHQWEETMYAIVKGEELPEPSIKKRNLEELELTYKAIGLHLLFLYRLGQATEAHYWERIRAEISDQVHERLKTDVKNFSKKCKNCGRKIPWESNFQICDACHAARYRRRNQEDYRDFK